MTLQYILEKITNTNDRKKAIINILEETQTLYTLQKIEFEYKKPKTNIFMLAAMTGFESGKLSEEDFMCAIEEMDDSAYEEFLMCYEEMMYDNCKTESYTEILTNIIVDIGDFNKAEKKIILSAHHDIVKGSSGANDNGSSIAILLKLIAEKPDICARIVFFDGEETGGRGSRKYIEEYVKKEDKNNTLLINLDVCGCGDLIVTVDNSGPFNIGAYGDIQIPRFPFSDAMIFDNYGIPTYSISVFPERDIDMGKRKIVGSELWKYMHCGSKDDIGYINYEIMERVYNMLSDCIVVLS